MSKSVLLDAKLRYDPPSSWTLKTKDGSTSWQKYGSHLDKTDIVLMKKKDLTWRSVEHMHFPKECYIL